MNGLGRNVDGSSDGDSNQVLKVSNVSGNVSMSIVSLVDGPELRESAAVQKSVQVEELLDRLGQSVGSWAVKHVAGQNMQSCSEVGGQEVGQGHGQNVADDVLLVGVGLLLELEQLEKRQVGLDVGMLIGTLGGSVFLQNRDLFGIVSVQRRQNGRNLLGPLFGLLLRVSMVL